MLLRTRATRVSQPAGYAALDAASPLAGRLLGGYLYTPAGQWLRGAQSSPEVTLGASVLPGQSGAALTIPATSSQLGVTVPGGLPWTLQTGGSTLVIVIDGVAPGAGAAQSFLSLGTSNMFGYDTAGRPRITVGGTHHVVAPSAMTPGRRTVLAYSYLRGQVAKIYMDGALVASSTPSVVGIDYAPTLFGHTNSTSTHGRHVIYFAALFAGGVLSDKEVAQLSSNPWGIFKPAGRALLFDLPPSASGSDAEGAGVLPGLTATAAAASAVVDGNGAGALPSVTSTAPLASAQGSAVAASAPPSISASAPNGMAAASSVASCTLAQASINAPAAMATGTKSATAAGALTSVAATSPVASASGTAVASAAIQPASITAPAASAFSGASALANGALAGVSASAVQASASGGALASGVEPHVSVGVVQAAASADSTARGSLAGIGIEAPQAMPMAVVSVSASASLPGIYLAAPTAAAFSSSGFYAVPADAVAMAAALSREAACQAASRWAGGRALNRYHHAK